MVYNFLIDSFDSLAITEKTPLLCWKGIIALLKASRTDVQDLTRNPSYAGKEGKFRVEEVEEALNETDLDGQEMEKEEPTAEACPIETDNKAEETNGPYIVVEHVHKTEGGHGTEVTAVTSSDTRICSSKASKPTSSSCPVQSRGDGWLYVFIFQWFVSLLVGPSWLTMSCLSLMVVVNLRSV